MTKVLLKTLAGTALLCGAFPLFAQDAPFTVKFDDVPQEVVAHGRVKFLEMNAFPAENHDFENAADLSELRGEVLLRLHANGEVRGGRISLQDISDCDSSADICQELNSVDLGVAPKPGQNLILNRTMIKEILRRDFPGVAVQFKGPDLANIRAAVLTIGQADVQKTLTEAMARLQSDEDIVKMELTHLSLTTPLRISPGEFSLEFPQLDNKKDDIEQLAHLLAGNPNIEVVYTSREGREPIHFWAQCQWSVSRKFPVAKQKLAAGTLLRSSDFTLQWAPISRGGVTAVETIDSLVGMKLKRNVAANETVPREAIEVPKVMERGAAVALQMAEGNLNISTKGRALGAGGIGQTVEVEMPNGRRLHAKIIDEKTVQVLR